MTRRVLSMALLSAFCMAGAADANPWPSWRGPEQCGLTREKAVVKSWPEDASGYLWSSEAGGRTTPIVMNGRVCAIGPVGSGECTQERVFCLDADTGEMLWEHRFPVFHTDIVENRVGWTVITGDPETGQIFAHGTGGEVMAFDENGFVLWKRSLTEEFGRYSGYGGRLHSPIVDEDRVIISIVYILSQWDTGKQKAGHRYYCLRKLDGAVLWESQPGGRPHDTTYSTPVITVVNNQRLLIAGNADGGVYAIQARTGKPVWSFKLSKRGINSSVVAKDGRVYVTHSEENLTGTKMGSVLCLDATKTGDITETGVIWRVDGITAGYSSPALANDRLYVATNSGQLLAMSAKDGTKFWEYDLGTVMKGSPVVTSDGVIYVGEVNGRFHILKDAGDKAEPLGFHQFEDPKNRIVEIFGSPAVADGRLYVMTRYETVALGEKENSQRHVPYPKIDDGPATMDSGDHTVKLVPTMQLAPSDILLRAGENVALSALIHDEDGKYLADMEELPPQFFEIEGVNARMSGANVLAANSDPVYSAGKVTLRFRGMESSARVRVVPPLPISESFDGMKAGTQPPGWIGVDLKTELVDLDGNIALKKKAESPSAPYSRMRAFSNPPRLAGYTVEADVMGEAKKGRHPVLSDLGLINCRYNLILMGYEQTLRVVTWAAMPRIQKEVPFKWEEGKWYTMKFEVRPEGDKNLLLGKVWPKGEEEPGDWMIRVEDDCPNKEGSPGLYAYSKGTTARKEGSPVYFDNYRVYRND